MADTSEHTREYHKLYYKNNKSKWSKTSKEYNKKYYQDNKEAISKRWREYYIKNIEQRKLASKEYRKKNKEYYLAYKRWRETRILDSNDNTITQDNLMLLLDHQKNKCSICWCNLKYNKKHLDHIIPISKWWIHSIFNVQRLCAKCNLEKSSKYPKWQLSIFNV